MCRFIQSKRFLSVLCALVMVLQLFAGTGVALTASAAEEEVPTQTPIFENPDYSFAERAADLVARMTLKQKGSQLVSTASAIPASALGGGALNVPATKGIAAYEWWSEALHGFSRGAASETVMYPQSLTAASTWNPELYYREAVQIGDEIREKSEKNSETGNAKNLNMYSPTVNMHRDPRWGRNEESFSEDVYLTGKMASEFVFGLEGKDRNGTVLDPDGYLKTMGTIKHYAANNSERNRLDGGAQADLRSIREYYTAPYRNVIQAAGVRSVMTAYSTLNSEPCTYSSYLMDTLLRQTFGFNGHITSDCDATATQERHNYQNPYTGQTMTDLEALAGALAHGDDLECSGGYTGFGTYETKITRMVEAAPMTDKGVFTENAVDVALHHLMTDRIATGEFDENLTYTADAAARMAEDRAGEIMAERLAISDEINREGIVLLKNNGLLPLQIPAAGPYHVAIVGLWQTDMYTGLYSSDYTSPDLQVNIQQGLVQAIKKFNPEATFSLINSNTLTPDDNAAIQKADAAVVVVGTSSHYSREDGDRTSTALPNGLDELISTVGKLNPKTVAIMETCGEMQVKTFENDVAAILWSSFGGQRKGVGFADIIVGNVNPSGKLTDTWYQDVSDDGESDIPDILDYNMYATNGSDGRTYMYYRGEKSPSYPFGYGLSYTTYEYSDLTIDKTAYDANDTVKVSFKVKNTGSVAGKEITQLYVAQPDAPVELNRPIRRLEGFDKIALEPGETKTVEMEVKIPDLAYFDETDKRYEVDTGAYQIQVGKDSAHADLKADFTVTGTLDVYPVLLTVKANQSGDTDAGIEERLIFDKGTTVNPQLTVTMNDESLWGYVIAHQSSPIDQVASSSLPEGMTFTYESNRPSVVKVEGDRITAVGAGVATVTVKGTLDDHTVSAEFVVYVKANAFLDSITLDGRPINGFSREKLNYAFSASEFTKTPVIGYTCKTEGLDIEVRQLDSIPGVAEIISRDPASDSETVYRIGIGSSPVSTDFSEGKAAAEALGWSASGSAENAVFDESGMTIQTEADGETGLFMQPGFGDWAAQTTLTIPTALEQEQQQVGMTVRDTDRRYVQLAYGCTVTVIYGVPYVSRAVTAYEIRDGEKNLLASTQKLDNVEQLGLRIAKIGEAYNFEYSLDGESWTILAGKVTMDMAEPKVGVFCSGTATAASFDGLNVITEPERLYPRLSSVSVNGKALASFDPEVFSYNFTVAEGAAPPVLDATVADDTEIEITQLDQATGVAKICARNELARVEYSFFFNYSPTSEYFADGQLDERWGHVQPNNATYSIEPGKGLVLSKAAEGAGTAGAWENCFTAPAQGNWQVVAKYVYPQVIEAMQQSMLLAWQDEAVNAHLISYIVPDLTAGTVSLIFMLERNDQSYSMDYAGSGAAEIEEDGSLTIYYMIDKAGNDYTFGYSVDGINFTKLSSTKDLKLNDPKIALFAAQGYGIEPSGVQCEYVAATWSNGVQQMSYEQMQTWAAQSAADYLLGTIPENVDAEQLALINVPHGYQAELVCSDPSVISAEGKVTPGEKDLQVQLSVKVTNGSAAGISEKTVTVPGKEHVCPGAMFTDMPARNNWAHDAIDWAIDNEITNGTSKTTFSPNAGCTRSQVVTFLWRAAGCPEPKSAESPFTDLKAGVFYEKAVAWAVEEGITNGTSDTTFSPESTCTRGQIVTFLWRFKGEAEPKSTQTPFNDLKPGAFYEKAVAWAVENDVTNGVSADKFGPDATCTRAQVVTFLYRSMTGE